MEVRFTPEEIVRLSPTDRIALIAQLWDSHEHDQQAAREELIAAQDWYDGESAGLGRRFGNSPLRSRMSAEPSCAAFPALCSSSSLPVFTVAAIR